MTESDRTKVTEEYPSAKSIKLEHGRRHRILGELMDNELKDASKSTEVNIYLAETFLVLANYS